MGAQREGNRCCWHRGTGNSSIRKEQQGKNGAKQQILMKRKREENCYYLTANTGSLLRWHLGKIGREFLFTSFSSSWTLPLKFLVFFFFFPQAAFWWCQISQKRKHFLEQLTKWHEIMYFIKFKGQADSLGCVLFSDTLLLNCFSLKFYVLYTIGNATRIKPNNLNSHCIITDRQRNTSSSYVK